MAIEYHEPPSELSAATRQIHRAISTLCEEWEAVNWYQQRLDVTEDEELKAVLKHNRDEEIEHAAMALEWLRRTVPEVDEIMRTYLFTTAPITEVEEEATGGGEASESGSTSSGDLGIGKLSK